MTFSHATDHGAPARSAVGEAARGIGCALGGGSGGDGAGAAGPGVGPRGAQPRRLRVAVVGTGIAGLAAAFGLQGQAELTLYEQDATIGGHAHTVEVAGAAGRGGAAGTVQVDMGFIVYNEPTYPNLTALFDHLGVKTETTDMSLGVSLDDGRLEYAGGYLGQLFAQRRNLARPRFWSMLADLVRFYRTARHDIGRLEGSDITLGAYLDAKRYGAPFREDHLLPMAAAIWSIPAGLVLEYPAHAFIRFHDNHGLLKLTNRPLWRTVSGGSRRYVEAMAASFNGRVRRGERVVAVGRDGEGATVRTQSGRLERYDHVVIAAHADQALAMLEGPTTDELRLLGAIRYQGNDVVLHSDPGMMPKRRRAWASWNYIGETRPGDGAALAVTYWMNRLQNLKTDQPLFVSLNPNRAIDGEKIHATRRFDHPVLDVGATRAQRQLWTLQGAGGVWFCGAYFGAGFHEDGLQAGLAVAEAIGRVTRPWLVANPSGRIELGAGFGVRPAAHGEGVAA